MPGIIAAALFMLSCSPSQDYELLFDEQIAEMSGSVEDSGTKGETAISESETEAEEEKTVSAFRIHCSEETPGRPETVRKTFLRVISLYSRG